MDGLAGIEHAGAGFWGTVSRPRLRQDKLCAGLSVGPNVQDGLTPLSSHLQTQRSGIIHASCCHKDV